MPFVLLLVGLTLLFAAINNTQKALFSLVSGDFTGTGSFIYWLAAIALVGGLGYIPQMRGLSHAFLALILIVLILHQDPTKIFGNLTNALASSTGPGTNMFGDPANSVVGQPQLPNLNNSQLPELLNIPTLKSIIGGN